MNINGIIRTFPPQSARHGDPHTHTIENVDLDHEGLYTCVVGNGGYCVLTSVE